MMMTTTGMMLKDDDGDGDVVCDYENERVREYEMDDLNYKSEYRCSG